MSSNAFVASLLSLSAVMLGVDSCVTATEDLGYLRSAFMFRDVHDQKATNSHVRDLQRHFDQVIHLLESNSANSLRETMSRIEGREGREFDPDRRRLMYQELRESRAANIARLAEYRDRGVFPINNLTGRRLPIFVDDANTACAVGYLMRQSGWHAAVADIHDGNNYVFVDEVQTGPLIDWVLESGLTQQEAALIQPGYFPSQLFLGELLNQQPFEFEGLRFSNFDYEVASVGNAGAVAADNLGLIWGTPDTPVYPNGDTFHSAAFGNRDVGSHWLFAGSMGTNSEVASSGDGGQVIMRFEFDVESINGGDRISEVGLEVTPGPRNTGGTVGSSAVFNRQMDTTFSVTSSLLDSDGVMLGENSLDESILGPIPPDPIFEPFIGSLSTTFSDPLEALRVETVVDLSGGQFVGLGTVAITFQVVPEPACFGLGLLSLAVWLFICRPNRKPSVA